MQYDNFALGPNLANGFGRSGQGNFTTAFGCVEAQQSFNDVTGGAGCGRSSAWAFDVLNVEEAISVPGVPEPGTWAMMLIGLGVLGAALRRGRGVTQRLVPSV